MDENARLKKLLAEAILDNSVLRDVAKKMMTPAARREAPLTSNKSTG